jgi:hypothetical protein
VRIPFVFGQGGNAGDAQQLFQLIEEARLILPDVTIDGFRHSRPV